MNQPLIEGLSPVRKVDFCFDITRLLSKFNNVVLTTHSLDLNPECVKENKGNMFMCLAVFLAKPLKG